MKLHAKSISALVFATICLLGTLSFAAKIKVSVQSRKGTDFSHYKTYAWLEHPTVSRPVLAIEVVGAVDHELKARGFVKVEEAQNPDVLLTFYGGSNTGINIQANDPRYAANGGVPPVGSNMWLNGIAQAPNLTSIYVSKGTLVIDMVDTKDKDLVWRGTATGNVDMTTDKALQAIDEAVEKMFSKYPPKK